MICGKTLRLAPGDYRMSGKVFVIFVLIAVALAAAVLVVSCSDEAPVTAPPKSPPVPGISGLDSARPGSPLTLCIGTQAAGAGVEYQFDFGAGGPLSGWSPDSCRTHGWAFEGSYNVRVRARRGTLVSGWSNGWRVTIIDETVTPPNTPTVDPIVTVGQTVQVCGSAAVSSKAHPIEYRFRVDPDRVMDWHIDKCAPVRWTVPGTVRMRAQARCVLHNGIFSQWSQSVEVMATSGVDTRIVEVLNSPSPGSGSVTAVNFEDAVPDTLPMGSWVTVVVEGNRPNYAIGSCVDPVNQCVGFQLQYERVRASVAASRFTSPWLPVDPFDGNPTGVLDTLRLNVGSVEYTIRARASDEFGPDTAPASFSIVGNLAPFLDDFSLRGGDDTVIPDGGTLAWNWWAPDNSDTLDLGAGERKKQFSLVIKAAGRDDPRDSAGSGIRGWRYLFSDVETQTSFFDFARAGFTYVEALDVNALCDTFTWTVRYPADDVNGDTVFAVLPAWIDQDLVFSIRGRDSSPGSRFRQLTYLKGVQELVNEYDASGLGRVTRTGSQTFRIRLTR